MKVLFVSTMSGFSWGGSERLWAATAREALRVGWHVAFSTDRLSRVPDPVVDLIARGALWLPLDVTSEKRRSGTENQRSSESNRTPKVGRLLFEERPDYAPLFDFAADIICISQGSTYDFLELEGLNMLLGRTGRPYIVLCRHNFDDLVLTADDQRRAVTFFSSARHIGFAALRNLRSAERQLSVRLPNASVIQSPIDLADFSPIEWPELTAPAFACVARLDVACKGQDLLLECLGSPAWAEREWHLQLYGEGPDRTSCEEMIRRRYAFGDRVRLAGHVQDISGVWRRNHLLVLPSRTEGTPQSLIEAMICGRPSVCTDVGGVGEWLRDQDCGFIAEEASISALGCALDRAWEARADWKSIGRTANRVALDRLDRCPEKGLLELLATAAQTASGDSISRA